MEHEPRQMGSSRLIVVSNREPYEHRRLKGQLVCQRTDGGLTAALDPVLRRWGGTWIAWGSGVADREVPGQADGLPVPPGSPAYRLRRVWLRPNEVRGGCFGYANQVLWPLCHITLDRVAYRKDFWENYLALNHRFAETVLDELDKRPGLLWVHDFHLAPLPGLIRQSAPEVKIAVFWHTPWPGSDVLRILPERRELLQGLLAADCVTFQTADYARAFADCAEHFLGAEVDSSTHIVRYQKHETRISARAISVDFRSLSDLAETKAVQHLMNTAREQIGLNQGIRIGLGVDRLDYTKGLLKRFWGLDNFFGRYPEYRRKFTFVQIAIPTRSEVEAYRRYREVIRETVAEINARLSSGSWHPIEYLEGRISLPQLVAYYRLADVALVSSVYDGMNLVAKEFIACQVDATGVLLVSEMAGAAQELTDALAVNPYDTQGLADAIRQALEMPETERRDRMRLLRAHLETYDIHAWVEMCLRDAGLLSDEKQVLGE
jgi:alpha,alpha-trehalose-phosphate synthase [UDP-forming]